jgi:cytoskeletal protein CcmA (bactofilin family)
MKLESAMTSMKRMTSAIGSGVLVALLGSFLVGGVPANASDAVIVSSVDCSTTELPRNDDGSSPEVELPFSVAFFGETYDSLWVNNNGNVSFEGPMSTYTPFGLSTASVPIIAPFFADVDTGGSGSETVKYGYGETTFEGRPAFCVNWLNVGYFSNHFDKLNSFQLLLVSREDKAVGAFDIVFNYDSIEWETGDASGGSQGLGGASARVGFSAGTGAEGTFTEFAGSGVPGSFLDSSINALNRGQQDSTVNGRYIFAVRDGGTLVNRYVALGDSYQSGEGTLDYIAGTDIDGQNQCHRSDLAYPSLLVDQGVVNLDLDFRACSGAVVSTMLIPSSSTGAPWDDGIAQVDALSTSTRLVTVGIIGNDLGFAKTIEECITLNVTTMKTCQNEMGTALDAKLTSLESGPLKTRLIELYRLIRAKAPFARILAVSYPKFFPEYDNEKNCGFVYRTSDQLWMNAATKRADKAIGVAAATAGFEYVNMYDSNDGFEMCTTLESMNGIVGHLLDVQSESYHPNKLGHELMARVIELQLGVVNPSFEILPEQTIAKKFTVMNKTFTVNVAWPGSDVRTTLISPSGEVYSRTDTNGADHGNGETWEYYTVHDAEAGEWTIELFGLDVSPEGEPVTLTTFDEEPVNQLPTATIDVTGSGAAYTFDATTSTDADGSITGYLWDFGDGETATGVVANHTYKEPGEYRASLVVIDDDGDSGFGVATTTATVLDASLVTHSTTNLTNQLHVGSGDVVVDGDVNCNSDVLIAGSLRATGDIYLTNNCTVNGDVSAGGDLRMNSAAVVGGVASAAGRISLQKSVRIGGDVYAGKTVSSVDGTSVDGLISGGTVGGEIHQNAEVAPVVAPAFAGVSFTEGRPGFDAVTWAQWFNAAAAANSAPAWSAGLTSTPGCTVAPWGSSVNGPVIAVDRDMVVDARRTTSGCAAVTLQGMTVRLSGDLVVYADSIHALGGTKFESGDGASHRVELLVPGSAVTCDAGAVKLHANTATDAHTRLRVVTPGTLSVMGPASLDATADTGCLKVTGVVTVNGG